MIDTFGRKINYLRLSVTDRCNMRCRYCMPAEGVDKLASSEVLSYEDLFRIARVAVDQGVEKIRVTGGEPLVRKGIVEFLTRLNTLPGLRELVLTTNGQLLPQMADHLRAAGVERVNVSLDSLDPDTFVAITRRGDLRQVVSGLMAAERAGLGVKINMVVMRGINDHEIADFAELTLNRPVSVRFIEYMPSLKEGDWKSRVVPGQEIIGRLQKRFALNPVTSSYLGGPARGYRINGAIGELGIITAVSGHFCDGCNRLRVTASGTARSCLFSDAGADLKPLLSCGGDKALTEGLLGVVAGKPGKHQLEAGPQGFDSFAMSDIGG